MKSGSIVKRAYDELVTDGPVSLARGASSFVRNHPERFLTQLIWISYSEIEREDLESASSVYIEYGNNETRQYSGPDQGRYDPYFDGFTGTWEFPPSFVACIEDVTLLPPYGVGVVPSRKAFLAETYYGMLSGWHETVLRNRALFRPFTDVTVAPAKTYDVAACLVRVSSEFNIGNAMFEELPRLHGIEQYEEATGDEVTVFIDPDSPAWKRELYKRMGLSEEQLEEFPDHRVAVERFVVPVHRKLGEKYSPDTERRAWVRDTLRNSVDERPTDDFSDRLYVSRQEFGTRYVENFEEIEPILRNYGFDVVAPETIPIREQIARFSGASILLGPWGGAFNYLVFADDATVVNFIQPEYMKPDFYLLAKEFGHRYRYLVGEKPENPLDGLAEPKKDTTFRIDPETLRAELETVVGLH
jgi:hypothetical protein